MQQVSDIQVYDRSGEPVGLRSFWDTRSVVFVFVRHFG